MFEKEMLDNITGIFQQGDTVLFPTDTVWSLGCDALNPMAVIRLRRLKAKHPASEFTVLVRSLDMLKQHVRHVHPRIDTLLAYHKRPLTILFDQVANLPQELQGEEGFVAFRITQDPFCQQLIDQLGHPILATSADFHQDHYPRNFGEISSEVICSADYVARYRQQEKNSGELSVMVSVGEDGELFFLRE